MSNNAIGMSIAMFMLFNFLFMIVVYVFSCYILSRIGRKFNIGTFGQYLIPIYNVMLLLRCIRANELYVIGFFIPFVNIALSVYLFGSIAQRLGKDFWLFGILSLVLGGIPLLFLAFDDSMPLPYGSVQPPFTLPDMQNDSPVATPRPAMPMAATPIQAAQPPSLPPAPPQNLYNSPQATISQASNKAKVAIYFIAGEYAGNQIEIPPQGLVIGRDPAQAGIILTSTEISRAHLRISIDSNTPTTILLEDLNSANGTFIKRTGAYEQNAWEKITILRLPIDQINSVMLGEAILEFNFSVLQ